MSLGTVLQNDWTSAFGSLANTLVCTNTWPPSCERATWVPDACHATQTVPSDGSTATDGSVAFVCDLGETCVVNPVEVPPRARSGTRRSPATRIDVKGEGTIHLRIRIEMGISNLRAKSRAEAALGSRRVPGRAAK